jgi:hypothetical protein
MVPQALVSMCARQKRRVGAVGIGWLCRIMKIIRPFAGQFTQLKSQVRTLAEDLGVPESIIDKAQSAGLWLGQTTHDHP